MNHTDVFNQNESQMRDYLESRIEAMKRRIEELERENKELRQQSDWRHNHELQIEAIR